MPETVTREATNFPKDEAKPLTKERVIPSKWRIVGYKIIEWILDLSRTELEMLVSSHIVPFAKNEDGDYVKGRFDIIEVVRAVVFEERSRKSRFASVKTMAGRTEHAKLQKLEIQSERELIQNEMMKGTVVRLEDVDAEVIDMHLATRSKLMGYPAHVARLVLGKEDFDEVVKILTHYMEEALVDLKPIDPDSIRARNRKMAKYAESIEEDDKDDDLNGGEKRPVGRPRKDSI